jgi:hypothetical protein
VKEHVVTSVQGASIICRLSAGRASQLSSVNPGSAKRKKHDDPHDQKYTDIDVIEAGEYRALSERFFYFICDRHA